jgi:hypothetical protein
MDSIMRFRGAFTNKKMYILLYAIFPLLFIMNLLLIKEGKDFTGYRNMLFYTSDIDLLTPLIVFMLGYILIILFYQKIKMEAPKDKLHIIIVLLLLAASPQIAFLNIPETNPDFIRYYEYSEILKKSWFTLLFRRVGNWIWDTRGSANGKSTIWYNIFFIWL